MKNFFKSLSFVLAIFFVTSGLALADGWDAGSKYNNQYDRHTVKTVDGEIISLHRSTVVEPGTAPGVMAVLDTGDEILNVHIGPKWFTEHYRADWDLKAGDKVTVTGSIVNIDGSQAMLLRSGEKGDRRLVVRDLSGRPVWDPQILNANQI